MVCAWSVRDVLTVFRITDMSCTSTMKHGRSERLLLVAYEPFVNRKSWMSRTSRAKNFYPGNFLEFVGNGIGMPVKSGIKFFENPGHSKFGHTENSREMLDQYYLINHGQ